MRTANGELVLVVVAAVCIGSIGCEQTMTSQSFKESTSGLGQNEDQQLATNTLAAMNRADGLAATNSLRANSRLLAVPLSLARFMFPNSRQAGAGQHRQTQATLMTTGAFGQGGVSNSKRSSSSDMDTLLGVSALGKRSVPLEYINLEPIFGRQNLVRGPSRLHEVSWGPVDVIEAPIPTSDY